MPNKAKNPLPHIWKLILFILLAAAFTAAVIVALAKGMTEILGGLVGEGILVALLGLWWRKSWPMDRVLLASNPEKQLKRLEKVTNDRQLLAIAKRTDPPVQQAALDRLRDSEALLDAARNFDTFAILHMKDPETLFRVVTEQGFFRKPRGREVVGYQQRMDETRALAVEAIDDPDTLRRLMKTDVPAAWFAVKKLLREHPELARSMAEDRTLPQPKREYAVNFLKEQTEQEIQTRPEAASVLFADRTLPKEARLAALEHITDEAVLLSLYDVNDDKDLRKRLVQGIREQAALIRIAETEPDKGIRMEAENRVTDAEKRREYCERDGAHLWMEKDSRWESYGDWHYEYITYRCPYCGREYETEGDSRKD